MLFLPLLGAFFVCEYVRLLFISLWKIWILTDDIFYTIILRKRTGEEKKRPATTTGAYISSQWPLQSFFFVSFRIWVFHLSWGSISAFLVVSSNDWNLYAIYWFICHTHDRSHRENHTQYTQLDGATNLLTFATNKTYTDFRCVAHYVLLLCIRRSEENMGEKG